MLMPYSSLVPRPLSVFINVTCSNVGKDLGTRLVLFPTDGSRTPAITTSSVTVISEESHNGTSTTEFIVFRLTTTQKLAIGLPVSLAIILVLAVIVVIIIIIPKLYNKLRKQVIA